MRIHALEVPTLTATDEDFARLAVEEAAHLWRLVQQGTVRETWFRDDRAEAVLVLESPSTADARAVLATLPFVAAGLITFEVIGLRPYRGFERLFAHLTEGRSVT